MAPPILVAEDEAALGGATYASAAAAAAVPAQAMSAIQVTKEFKATLQTSNGPQTYTIAKGTYGYLVRKSRTRGMWQVQLFDPLGNQKRFVIPDGIFTLGAKHGQFRVIMPAITASATHAAVGHSRLNDPAGKVIAQLWANFAKNKDVLRRLGFKDIEVLAGNQAELDKKVKTLLGAFRSDAWAALNSKDLTLKRLLALRPVSSGYPNHTPGQNQIYIRLYFDGNKSAPDKTNFAKYGGRTSFDLQLRNQQHEKGISSDRDKRFMQAPHWVIARKFAPGKRVMIPMMSFDASISKSDTTIALAETTICCLLRTFHTAAFRQAPSDISSGIQNGNHLNRLLLKNVVDITDQVMRKLKFPRFGGTGTNWSFPMSETYAGAREWVLHKVTTSDGQRMSTFKSMTHVSRRKKKAARFYIEVGFSGQRQASSPMQSQVYCLRSTITEIVETHSMPYRWPLILSVEIMDSGVAHHSPWSRLPYIGAFDNYHELASLAVKIEFYSPARQGWFSQYLTNSNVMRVYNPALSSHNKARLGSLLKNYVLDDTVLSAWRDITTLLQIFKGRRYRNNEIYLLHYATANVKEAIYDHLAQTVSFRPMPVTEVDPPKRMTFEGNCDLVLELIQGPWNGLQFGPRPGADWFMVGFKTSAANARPLDAQPACLLCRCSWYTHHFNFSTTECAARPPFSVDSADPDVEDISTMSCPLCWRFFRAPCIWVPKRLIVPGPRGNGYCQLLPKYDGATVVDRSEFPASTISAPMSMETYLGDVDLTKGDEDGGDEDGEDEDADY